MTLALVAGGAGFVGSHLTEALMADGVRVVAVDDLSTGRRSNIEALGDTDRLTFIEHDLVDPGWVDLVERACRDDRIDLIFHLASPAAPQAYLARPLDTLDVGSLGTRALLTTAERHGARFVLASTSEVYGDPLEHPQAETYWGNVNPVGERAAYDEAKRFAEAMTMVFHRSYGVDVRIARIFNTYGPRMALDDGRVVTNMIRQAITGAPITVYGDGSQTRSFCYISDLIHGLIACAEGDHSGPINLGNPTEVSILTLAETIRRLTGSTSPIDEAPLPVDDPKVRRPSIELAREALGWRPHVDLDTGLMTTIDDVRRRIAPLGAD